MAKDEDYSFTLHSGGLLSYDGVLSSAKEVKKIEVTETDINDNEETITIQHIYEDGHKSTYIADIKETEDGFEIINKSKTWE